MDKKSLIYGVTGQDGGFLSELLLSQDHEVYGVKRRTSTDNTQNISGVLDNPNFHLVEGDICDAGSVNHIISTIKPTNVFNVAAMSHVHTSFSQPTYTFQVDALGQLYILDACRLYSPDTHIQFASTSECFGGNYSTRQNWELTSNIEEHRMSPGGEDKYQDENTPFAPNSPYAVAKVAGTNLTRLYRESYGLHASNTICFNHESERRGENFVTRKITKWISDNITYDSRYNEFSLLTNQKLKLGNIDTVRDWGYAPDYVRAFIKVVEHDTPDDYVIGTGEAHTIKEFLEEAFSYVDADWKNYVEIDPELYRPCEVPYLRCDASKIKGILGWEPTVKFKELVKIMMTYDLSQKQYNT